MKFLNTLTIFFMMIVSSLMMIANHHQQVDAACSSVTSTLSAIGRTTNTVNESNVEFLVADPHDSSYFYSSTYGYSSFVPAVIQYAKGNSNTFERVKNFQLNSGENCYRALVVMPHGPLCFATVTSNPVKAILINANSWTRAQELSFLSDETYTGAVAADGKGFAYVIFSSPGRLVKIFAGDSSLPIQRAGTFTYGSSLYANAMAAAVDSIFLGFNTGAVYKIDTYTNISFTTMQLTASINLTGANAPAYVYVHAAAIAPSTTSSSTSYVYFFGGQNGSTVVSKLQTDDLTEVSSVNMPQNGGATAGASIRGDSIFIPIDNNPPKIMRISACDMSFIDNTSLTDENGYANGALADPYSGDVYVLCSSNTGGSQNITRFTESGLVFGTAAATTVATWGTTTTTAAPTPAPATPVPPTPVPATPVPPVTPAPPAGGTTPAPVVGGTSSAPSYGTTAIPNYPTQVTNNVYCPALTAPVVTVENNVAFASMEYDPYILAANDFDDNYFYSSTSSSVPSVIQFSKKNFTRIRSLELAADESCREHLVVMAPGPLCVASYSTNQVAKAILIDAANWKRAQEYAFEFGERQLTGITHNNKGFVFTVFNNNMKIVKLFAGDANSAILRMGVFNMGTSSAPIATGVFATDTHLFIGRKTGLIQKVDVDTLLVDTTVTVNGIWPGTQVYLGGAFGEPAAAPGAIQHSVYFAGEQNMTKFWVRLETATNTEIATTLIANSYSGVPSIRGDYIYAGAFTNPAGLHRFRSCNMSYVDTTALTGTEFGSNTLPDPYSANVYTLVGYTNPSVIRVSEAGVASSSAPATTGAVPPSTTSTAAPPTTVATPPTTPAPPLLSPTSDSGAGQLSLVSVILASMTTIIVSVFVF